MNHCVAFFCLVWLLFTAPAASAMEAVVAVDHFPPWKIVDAKEIDGVDIELTKALLKEVDITPRFVICPWARCLDMLKNGKADLVSGILKRSGREAYLTFIEPPYKDHSNKVFYRRVGSDDINTFQDLTNLRIGTQLKTLYFPRFDDDTSLDKHSVNKDEFNFLKLAEGRLDTVIATESQGDYHIARLGLSDLLVKSSYQYAKVNPVYFAVSKRSPLQDKLPELSAAVKKLKENGTFDTIIRNYMLELQKASHWIK